MYRQLTGPLFCLFFCLLQNLHLPRVRQLQQSAHTGQLLLLQLLLLLVLLLLGKEGPSVYSERSGGGPPGAPSTLQGPPEATKP